MRALPGEMVDVRRALALRAGGQVERVHTKRTVKPYSVAEHSFNVACLLDVLFRAPIPMLQESKLRMMTYALRHDVAERWIGDSPAPLKWAFPEIKRALDEAEEKALDAMGISMPSLHAEERQWLKALDLIELYLWAIDERALGNRTVGQIMDHVAYYIEERRSEWPQIVIAFWDEIRALDSTQVSDNPWGEVWKDRTNEERVG